MSTDDQKRQLIEDHERRVADIGRIMGTKKPSVTIELGDNLCERGNTWLTGDDGNHVAWFHEGETENGKQLWLEASVCPGNYPGFNVCVVEATEAEMCDHIHQKCNGWFVHRCNFEGVNIDSNNQIENPDEDEDTF